MSRIAKRFENLEKSQKSHQITFFLIKNLLNVPILGGRDLTRALKLHSCDRVDCGACLAPPGYDEKV